MKVLIMIALLAAVGCSAGRSESITQGELVRRTQELLDAVTAGDRTPFERYIAEDTLDHDEKGRRIIGDTAILSYDLEETETISGQTMQARYHTTDTWLRRGGKWQIIAEQALRYYADPAVGRADVTRYGDYAGLYELEPGKTRELSSLGESLYMQRTGKEKELLFTEAGDLYFRKDVEVRILFRRDTQGKVDALIDRRNNEDIVWRKIH